MFWVFAGALALFASITLADHILENLPKIDLRQVFSANYLFWGGLLALTIAAWSLWAGRI